MDKPWLDKRIAAIATQVMGFTWDDDYGGWRTHYPQGPTWEIAGWNPLEHIDHAWQVVAKMRDSEDEGEFADQLRWNACPFGDEAGSEIVIYLMRHLSPESICKAAINAKNIDPD